ncbi:MAG: T9SS type A sorting domain-containing protein [Flavobacteriales bacterium]|nr:T9SS type A sorting domain-containing protein [Flavobacteriales bacterium]MBP6696095.1 T9SS type A sorting domain-containing protein [Flavobacteriales bacterium]
MKPMLALLLLLASAASVHAQIPTVAWTRSLGSGSSDAGHFIHQLPDKSFFLAATSNSADGQLGNTTGPANGEVVFIGLDSLGQMQWGNRIGDLGSVRILHGEVMADGNYVVTGAIYDAGQVIIDSWGDEDLWIVKVSPAGSVIWERFYAGLVDQNDLGIHVAARSDGGCFVSGFRGQNDWEAWVIALDSDGNELWERTYGGSTIDIGQSIIATADGGALLAGWTGSSDGDVSTPLHGEYDGWLVKIDANGDIEWDRTYGGTDVDQFQDIRGLPGGDYLILGTSISSDGDLTENHGNWDVWLMRVDASGSIIWNRSYGGSLPDSPSDMIPYQGNYLIAGSTTSSDGDVSVCYDVLENPVPYGGGDGWLLLVSPNGDLLWEKSVGGSDGDIFYALAPTDNGFIATGISLSADHFVPGNVAYQDIWTVRFNRKSTLLAGTLYMDADNDTSISVDDPRIGWRLVGLSNNGELALSQPNGSYVFAVNGPAQHTITGPTIPHFAQDPATHTASITGNEPAVSGFDFRYTAGVPAQDLQVFLTPVSPFRPGFPVRYDVLCRNVGTMSVDADLSLVLDDGLGFDSTSIAPGSINGNMLTWALGPMLPLQNIQLSVYCTQSVADTLGSPVTTTAEITPIAGDLVPGDNTVTTNNQVTGSFDPNDILVEPTEVLVSALADAILDYTIRFQNTGTDTAFTVAVENHLPANASLPSFELIDASHPLTLTYYDFDHKMRFQFDNILLPDSNVNELMSHGFVRYRMRPRTDLVVGDSIRNTAAIHFDLNAPVITNTARTAIITTTDISTADAGAQMHLVPNPATDLVQLSVEEDMVGGLLQMHDASGRVVFQERVLSTRQTFDLSRLADGHYLLMMRADGAAHRCKLIKQAR